MQDEQRKLTYDETYRLALAVAHDLRRNGVMEGERVILLMHNSVGFCIAFWGVLLAGAVAVPLNPETKRDKLAWIAKDCGPRSLIVDDALLSVAVEAVQASKSDVYFLTLHNAGLMGSKWIAFDAENPTSGEADLNDDLGSIIDRDLAAIIYTSGSTGDPKGVMLTHLNMTTAARSVSQYLGYVQSDIISCAIPLTFDYGLHQLTMATLVGATLHVEKNFAQPLFALSRVVTNRATVLPIVPTMVPLIEPLADRFDLTSVRCITSTAAALHTSNIDKLAKLFAKATIFSMYGLTECHRCTYLDPAQLAKRKSSIGKAIPNTQLWLVDAEGRRHFHSATGELVIRGNTIMKGYWNNPEKTAEKLRICPELQELVLYTGDTCRLDEEGFLYFVARSDDILKVAGHKVAPTEIESALLAHDAVSQASVIGEDHAVHGQRPVAFVTLSTADLASSQDLLDWCRERLEPHAVPARIVILHEFTRNHNGKIDKHVLREQLPEIV
ncbi:amino acid adenylation domain-containing protein [Rhizobium mongolense subsp. loessense]|uniref:Amino acid adenylation domain-containing protein n=1 Tax=Rhizobium mongolense subsp. loessense TaxID=158890 RepID=A0A1G4U593_9HYPH|nr:amino acid adenylation domain-containing protein [Rhizobium mongolense subsp. loessense]